MKKIAKQVIRFSSVVALFSVGFSGFAWAEGYYGRDYYRAQEWQRFRERRQERSEFALGICVGQALAAQGITLPVPQAGQKPTVDATTKAAIQAATKSCRAELRGAPEPQPSPAPSSAPSPSPSETPAS